MTFAQEKRNGGRPRSRETPDTTIFSEETFRYAVHRERRLADRGHRQFCVAVIRLHAHGFRAARDPDIAKVLRRHARLTDEVGLLHGSAFGILLRETDADGADVFCHRVAGDLSKIGADAAWRVFCYPHPEQPDSSESLAGVVKNRGVHNDASEGQNDDGRRLLARPCPGWKRCLESVGAVL